MSGTAVAAGALLAAGVLVVLVCCAGVVWMRDPLDRLHFAAGGSLAAVPVAGAVLLTGASSTSAVVESVAALLLVAVLNPVLTHATGRAILRRRSRGGRP